MNNPEDTGNIWAHKTQDEDKQRHYKNTIQHRKLKR
jgi:hypothetical protein